MLFALLLAATDLRMAFLKQELAALSAKRAGPPERFDCPDAFIEECVRTRLAAPFSTSAKRGAEFLFVSHAESNELTVRYGTTSGNSVTFVSKHQLTVADEVLFALTGVGRGTKDRCKLENARCAAGSGSVGFVRGRTVKFALTPGLSTVARVTVDLGQAHVVSAPVVGYDIEKAPCSVDKFHIARATLPVDTQASVVLVLADKGTPSSSPIRLLPSELTDDLRQVLRRLSKDELGKNTDLTGVNPEKLWVRDSYQRFALGQDKELVRGMFVWREGERVVGVHALDFDRDHGRVVNTTPAPDLSVMLQRENPPKLGEDSVRPYSNVFDANGDGSAEFAAYDPFTCETRIGEMATYP